MRPWKRIVPGIVGGIVSACVCLAPRVTLGQSTAASADSASAGQSGALAPIDVTPSPNGSGDGMYIPLTKDQPFKVKFNVTIAKPLPDGSVVKQKYYVMAARDSAGYEYREARDMVAADSDREPALVRTIVYDPKNSTSTACFPAQQNCLRRHFDPQLQPAEEPPLGTSEDGQAKIQRESLGKRQIQGVEAEGVRETQTVKSGVRGNDKPLVTTRETWYSPQLKFYLSVLVKDPFGATREVEATDLKLGEPGKEWFAIPEGYRVVERRMVAAQARMMPTLEERLREHVAGISEAQLAEELKPVQAALLDYAKAHAAAAPNDPANKPLNQFDTQSNDLSDSRFVSNLQMRLVSEVQMMQTSDLRMMHTQVGDTAARMDAQYRAVMASPCIGKVVPGDPSTMPGDAAGLESEQKAWMQLYDAWTAFLKKLFPNSNTDALGFILMNERANDLRKMETVERNRGCVPEESMQASIERFVPAMTPEQLSALLKPVDSALNSYVRARMADKPNENEENFARTVESRLAWDLQQQGRGPLPTSDQLEEADLHLKQAFRAVIESPCIDRHVPGDPPGAPASADKLRAEETAWLAMRDAWVKFLASLYPNNASAGFGFSITEQRASELREIQNILRNRGCHSDEAN